MEENSEGLRGPGATAPKSGRHLGACVVCRLCHQALPCLPAEKGGGEPCFSTSFNCFPLSVNCELHTSRRFLIWSPPPQPLRMKLHSIFQVLYPLPLTTAWESTLIVPILQRVKLRPRELK